MIGKDANFHAGLDNPHLKHDLVYETLNDPSVFRKSHLAYLPPLFPVGKAFEERLYVGKTRCKNWKVSKNR